MMSPGSKKAPCEPVVDARSKRKRWEDNRSILATLPHPNIPLIVLDSIDDEEEEDEDVLPFSLNRSFKPSFPDEKSITLKDIEAVVGTIPWAEKENPCERPLAKKTAGQDGGKGRRSETHCEGDFVDDVAPKPKTVKGKILDESEVYLNFELAEDSGSGDYEVEDEQKDPLDWAWKEFAIMSQQDAIELALEEKKEDCVHSFITTLDFGRSCTICGLVVEHIKDMVFMWHKPVSKRKRLTPGERRPGCWSKEGDDAELEEPLRIPGLEVHPSLEEALHPHQLDGFKFLSRNLVEEDAGGYMLAFAPGTGKTFLVISFLQSFLIQVPHAKPMVVAPKGMLQPWAQEFKKWEVEEIPIFDLYEVNSVESQLDLLRKWQQRGRSVLLVGYPQFVNMTGDVGKLFTEGPGLLILDEGHLARTKNTKILTSLMQVRTKQHVLLSGTPFNNNSDEFYHTLELIRPNFMLQTAASLSPTTNLTKVIAFEMVAASQSASVMKPSNGRQAFKDIFGDGIDSGDPKRMTEALGHLRTFIAPFVLWHKGEILDTLPGISDFTVMVHITPMQRRLLDLSEMKNNDNLQKRAAAIYVHPVLEPVAETGSKSQDDLRLQGDVKVVVYRLITADTHEEHKILESSIRKDWLAGVLFDQNAACNDYKSILCDVTKGCSDRFLEHGPLRDGVRSIYEREFKESLG
ncbi:unnamed protein product [Sphagnum tenellum]